MPPKKPAAAEAPAPVPQAAPSPAVIAAAQNVEKWEARGADVAKRISENEQHLHTLATQKAAREARLRELYAEVSVIAMPKPPEPEVAAPQKGAAKSAAKGKAAADTPTPAPLPPDEDELKRLTKMQNAINTIYKKKRERPLLPVRETPPATADSAGTKHRPVSATDSMAATPADQHLAEGSAEAASPPMPDEPGIVKPADLDVEIWMRVLKLRDERIETEEALAGVVANTEVAEARARNLVTLRNVTGYSNEASAFDLEAAKHEKPPPAPPVASQQPKPPHTPQTPASAAARRNSNRPPSQLLRR